MNRNKQITLHVQKKRLVKIISYSLLCILLIITAYIFIINDKYSITNDKSQSIQQKSDIVINPSFHGINEEGKYFSIDAKTATACSHSECSDEVMLDNISADLSDPKDSYWMHIIAKTALFKKDSKELTIPEISNIFDRNGYEITAKKIIVDLSKWYIYSDHEVFINSSIGNIRADSFKIDRYKNQIYLHGAVRMEVFK